MKDLIVKASILIASGGAFLFTLICAKFLPASEYGYYVGLFSFVSYISFPFLYGFIPAILRESRDLNQIENPLHEKEYRNLLLAYTLLIILATTVWSSSWQQFLITLGALSMVLLTGAAEIFLRIKPNMMPLFIARALGMLISITFLILAMMWIKLGVVAIILRVIPSAFMVLVVVASTCVFSVPKGANKKPEAKGNKALDIASSSLIALIIGIFQYGFILLGSHVVSDHSFVQTSVLLMTGVTVCQKLIEPRVFWLYSSEGEVLSVVEAIKISWWIRVFIEIVLSSFLIMLTMDVLLFDEVSILQMLLISLGSVFVSVAYLLHTAIYIHCRDLYFTLKVFVVFLALMLLMFNMHIGALYLWAYLVMAFIYLLIIWGRLRKLDSLINLPVIGYFKL